MKYREQTSDRVASIAAKLLRNPEEATEEEIKLIAASVLTQKENRDNGN